MRKSCATCMHGPPPTCGGNQNAPDDCYYPRRSWGGTTYKDVRIKCPFYKISDGKSFVLCEGPKKRTSVTTRFYRGDELRGHIKKHCEDCYKSCWLYRDCMLKYDEAGE